MSRNLSFRARIVLGCETSSGSDVARSLRTTNQTVCKWRNRFVARCQVEAIVVKTIESTSKGRTHWSTRSIAKNVGLSHSTIGRIWRTFGLKPHVIRDFRLSDDPLLIEKVRDIVDLYMSPPENAVVLCVDEKSQIQALSRATPVLPMDLGQPEQRTHNYLRHGTTDLFAALNVKTGKVTSRIFGRHRAVEFLTFLVTIDDEVPADLDVHLVDRVLPKLCHETVRRRPRRPSAAWSAGSETTRRTARRSHVRWRTRAARTAGSPTAPSTS